MMPNRTNPFIPNAVLLGRKAVFLYRSDNYRYYRDAEDPDLIYKQSIQEPKNIRTIRIEDERTETDSPTE